MKRFFQLLVPFLLTAVIAFPQKQGQARIDSLTAVLATLKEDTTRVNLLNELSYSLDRANPDQGILYGSQALETAEKLHWKPGIARAYRMLGLNYFFGKADYPKALECMLKSLKISEEAGLKPGISSSLNNLGLFYTRLNDYPKALECYERAYRLARDLGDKITLHKVLINMGTVYQKQQNFPAALARFDEAFELNREIGNKRGCANALDAKGSLYRLQKDFVKAKQFYEEALRYSQEAGDTLAMTSQLETIGDFYRQQGEYRKTLDIFLKSLTLHKKIKDRIGIAYCYGVIGYTYFQISNSSDKTDLNRLFGGNREKAVRISALYADSTVALQKELGDLNNLMDSYISISDAWESIGDYKGALKNYKLYVAVRDSVFNLDKEKKLVQQAMKYDFEKKHATDSLRHVVENRLSQISLQKQKTYTWAGFIGMALVVLLLFFVFRNYSNQRKANIRLQEAQREILAQKERAEQSERFKQQFLANMSHEIRTPMNAVMGMTRLLIDRNPRPDQQQYLNGIRRSADILLHIINDILDHSKIESGKMELEKTDFSLRETVGQVASTLLHKAEEKGLQLLTNVDGQIPDVLLGDPVRLNQILMNLAGNAIKFTEKGSVQIEVRPESPDTENLQRIRFSVIDTGIGIPKEKLDSVFESFRQVNTSDTRKYGGTGLGLTISRQLVELHGGTLKVESEVGSGTCFSFVLEFQEGSAERLDEHVNEDSSIDGSILDGLRILVTDDNEYNRIVASDTLSGKADVVVRTATGGQEAIDLLQAEPFDIILMDVQMPGMNGFEATRFIRAMLPAPVCNIPIIALTASVLRTDLDKCRQAGMNAYVPKPFTAAQLIRGIAGVLGIEVRRLDVAHIVSEPAVADPGKVTDLAYLEKFCEGDREKMQKYVDMFMQSVPVLMEKVRAALASEDFEEVANQLHGFKTKFVMMGMKRSGEQSVALELKCREGSGGTELHREVLSLLADVENAVAELT